MNPTIIVQPNIGIPAGPLTKADSASQTNEKAKSVAAVIRPKPRATGKPESVRMDTANSNSTQPHGRTNQLDDYVNWLREKFQQDVADTRPDAQIEVPEIPTFTIPVQVETEKVETERVETLIAEPVKVEPVTAESAPTPPPAAEHVLSDYYFSSITTENEVPHELSFDPQQHLKPAADTQQHSDAQPDAEIPNRVDAQPKHEPARGFSSATLDRIDQPHSGLPKAYVTFDELKMGSETTPAVSFDPSLIETVTGDVGSLQPNRLSAEDTESFIATVSKAIASVLTESPEPAFEQKVRTHFESELQARAAQAISPSDIEAINTDKLDHTPVEDLIKSGGIPVSAMKLEADKIASEIVSSSLKEIPTSVAAWDVEDFRWPIVTNQMIVSGSEALDQLSQSVFNMIAPGNQRVAVAGLGRGEGTTSIAISMARWAAACGKNVLLIDADLVTPGLTTQVGLAPNLSWINAVSQSLASAEVIVRSQKSNLCIMPLAQMVSRVTWPRFIYDNLGEVIQQVQKHFDLVILDVGPANQLMAELSRPSLLVDATLLVHNGVNSPEFQKTKSRLEMFGINKFVVAQNRAQQKSANVA